MQKSVEKKRDLSWLFLLLLILGVLILLFSKSEDSGHASGTTDSYSQMSPAQKSKLVNKHLKETAISLEKERLQRKLEVSRELQKYSNSPQQLGYEAQQGLSFDSDPNMLALTEELNRSQALNDHSLTPEQLIQRKLYENEQLQKEDEAYREAYAEEFIENARRAGWDIKLGPNLEVISVQKIQPRQPSNIFDGFSPGSR